MKGTKIMNFNSKRSIKKHYKDMQYSQVKCAMKMALSFMEFKGAKDTN